MIKKIKKNKYQKNIEASLDLHGLTVLEAEAALTDFLLAARLHQWRQVRVITGKGFNSSDGRAVLKPWAEQWLTQRQYHFRPAKINDGGDGAVVITLV